MPKSDSIGPIDKKYIRINPDHLPTLMRLADHPIASLSPTYLHEIFSFLTGPCREFVTGSAQHTAIDIQGYRACVADAAEGCGTALTRVSPSGRFLIPVLRELAACVLGSLYCSTPSYNGVLARSSEQGFIQDLSRPPYRNGYWSDICLHSHRTRVDKSVAELVGPWIASGGMQQLEHEKLQGDGTRYCTGFVYTPFFPSSSLYLSRTCVGSRRLPRSFILEPPLVIPGQIHRESGDSQSYNIGIASMQAVQLLDVFHQSISGNVTLISNPSLPDQALFDPHHERPLALWYHVKTHPTNLQRFAVVMGKPFDPDEGHRLPVNAACLAAAGVELECVLQFAGDTIFTNGNHAVDTKPKLSIAGNSDEVWLMTRWLLGHEYFSLDRAHSLLHSEQAACTARELYVGNRNYWRSTRQLRPYVMVGTVVKRAIERGVEHVLEDPRVLGLLGVTAVHRTVTDRERSSLQDLVRQIVSLRYVLRMRSLGHSIDQNVQ